ncbi:MAG: hypothetical protein A2086_17050 [Spirochaetes bacterium GWD1_27_9]|nr:MAG: hypothetical protein A2Z98_15375 [Spirochaetes bacterium GWB1_27_13]OHD27373.1 MAG: hypothetical protein A2Y34_07620 [Spirochaetes bacterium GWC1_27_15]OHD33337.1 MAG: hypothetical protein A2086_17050 [Spirochaetes bacterium GWD1_27_9]
MKKILFIASIMLFIQIFQYAKELEKEKIVIFDFNANGVTKEIALAVTESIITEIVNLEDYIVIERNQLNKIYEELKLTASEDFSESNVIEIGKLAKAKIALIGSISKIKNEIIINARLINIETGAILFAEKTKAKSETEIDKAVEKLIKIMFEDEDE